MRNLISLLALILASALPAQEPAPAPRQQGGVAATTTAGADPIAVWLDSLAKDAHGLVLARSAVREGNQRVAVGESISGNIAAWHGNLDVAGRVSGNAVAVGGDVIVHPGAVVDGDALSIGGKVRNEGGTVEGEMRTLSASQSRP